MKNFVGSFKVRQEARAVEEQGKKLQTQCPYIGGQELMGVVK